MMNLSDVHLRERVHYVVQVAEWGLTALVCAIIPFVLLIGAGLAVIGFSYSVYLGLAFVLATFWILHFISGKQRTTREMLETVDEVVQGSTQRVKNFLHNLVDQMMSTVLLISSVLPLILLIAVVVLAVSHHNGAAGIVFLILIISTVTGACLYCGVHSFAWNHIDGLVDAILENGGQTGPAKNERTPLV